MFDLRNYFGDWSLGQVIQVEEQRSSVPSILSRVDEFEPNRIVLGPTSDGMPFQFIIESMENGPRFICNFQLMPEMVGYDKALTGLIGHEMLGTATTNPAILTLSGNMSYESPSHVGSVSGRVEISKLYGTQNVGLMNIYASFGLSQSIRLIGLEQKPA